MSLEAATVRSLDQIKIMHYYKWPLDVIFANSIYFYIFFHV